MSQQQSLQTTIQREGALEEVVADQDMSASSSANPGDVTKTLKRALATGHLMSPATSCPNLPLGTEVAFSAVKIDADRETYPVRGSQKLGIGKSALFRISKAIGINWNTQLSHRTDDGKDPRLAAYKAVGHYRDFDGTWRTIEGEKQMDLRDGTERAKAMSPGELSQTRQFIAEHAETKAKLRAIRSIGIDTAYLPEFFDEPFICARLVFTGRSDNPEIQKIFAEATAKAMMGGTEALYGHGALPPTDVSAEPKQLQGASADDSPSGQGNAAASATGQSEAKAVPAVPVWKVPFGSTFKNMPITDVPTDRLSGLLDYVENSISDGANASRADELNVWKSLIHAEIDRRKGDTGTVRY